MCDEQRRCFEIWENVLVDWANCLSISKKLQRLSDMRKSDFLTNILQLLTQSVITKETLPKLCQFLHKHYPNFQLSDKPDLESCDLVEIISLLMHYTCCHDRRDILTSPLCQKLSGDVQLKIRSFLERFGDRTEQNELGIIIAEVIGTEEVDSVSRTPMSHYQWHSGGDNQCTGKSPLQDFLRTPTFKSGRIKEKDKEIKRLRHELQVEKYEKEDMSLELKDHKEKIKRLNQQINEKALIVTKLHGEVVALENRTPPHKPREAKEIERLLRAELQDSQAYISQLQEEIDSLQNSKENLTKKLRTSEEEACLWQDKALTLDSKFETFVEKNREKELELSSLRMNYNELSALLDEMRSSRHEEDCFELDSSGVKIPLAERSSICYEDLAHSVVDVQLRESQQRNTELSTELAAAVHQSMEFERTLEGVKGQFLELKDKFGLLQGSNKQLESKILILKQTQVCLEKSNVELTATIKTISLQNSAQTGELKLLEQSLSGAKSALKQRDELVASLQNDLRTLETHHTELEAKLGEREASYKCLKRESDALQIEYEEAVQNCNQKRFELEAQQKSYQHLEAGIEENLKQLEEQICGKQSRCFRADLTYSFRTLLGELEQKNDANEQEMSTLIESKSLCKSLIAKLEQEIANLKSDKEIQAETINRYKEDLNVAKINSAVLESTVEKHEQRIKELSMIIDDMSVTIVALEGLKVTVKEKSSQVERVESENIVLRKEVRIRDEEILRRISDDERMRLLIKELESIQDKLRHDVDIHYEEMVQLRQENKANMENLTYTKDAQIKSIEADLEQLRDKYILENSDHVHQIAFLNSSLKIQEQRLVALEADLQVAEDNSKLKTLQLDDLSKLKQQIEVQYQKQMEDMQKKIDLLDLTVQNLKKCLKTYEHDKELLEDHMEREALFYEKLRGEKVKYIAECEQMRRDIVDLAQKLTDKEMQCSYRDDVISKSTQELLTLKLQLQNKHEEIQAFKAKSEVLHAEKQQTKLSVENLSEKNNELSRKIESMNLEMDILNQLKHDLTHKCDTLESNMLSLVTQLGVKKGEVSATVGNLIQFCESGTKEIKELKVALAETRGQLERATDERLTLTIEYDARVEELNNIVHNVNAELDDLRCREILALQEVGTLKDELGQAINKYADTLQAKRDLRSESDTQITSLTESIHSMVEKFNDLDARHKEVVEEHGECHKSLHDLNSLKQQLEIDLVKQKECYENEFVAAAEQYKFELEILSTQQTKLEEVIDRLSGELSEERGSRVRIESELDRAKADLQDVMGERAELLCKVESLIMSNQEFNREYRDLKIEHETYLKESKLTLSKTQFKLEESRRCMKEQQVEFEEVVETLRHSVGDLSVELEIKEKEYKELIKKKEEEIVLLHLKIMEFEGNVHRLEVEQQQLYRQIETEKESHLKNSNERDEQVKCLEVKITKLACANDILETGKKRLEEMMQELQDKYELLREEKSASEKTYEEEVKSLGLMIKNSNDLIQSKADEIKINQEKMEEYDREIEAVRMIVETLKLDLRAVTDVKNEMECRLEMIEEDNDRKIKEQVSNFTHVKCKYQQLKEEMTYVKEELEVLNIELVKSKEEKGSAEKAIKEKQEEIEELHLKYSSVTSVLSSKDGTLASLQEELEARLAQLEDLSGEKLRLEIKLAEVTGELENTKRARSDLLEKHTKQLQDMEEKLLRAHNDTVEAKDDLLQRLEDSLKTRQDMNSSFEQERCINQEILLKEKLANQKINSLLEQERRSNQEIQTLLEKERFMNGELETTNKEMRDTLEKEKLAKQDSLDKEKFSKKELENENLELHVCLDRVKQELRNSLETELLSKEELHNSLEKERTANREICAQLKSEQLKNDELQESNMELNRAIVKERKSRRDLELEKSSLFDREKTVQDLLEHEKKSKEFFELQLLDVKNERESCQLLNMKLVANIERLSSLIEERPQGKLEDFSDDTLDRIVVETEKRIIEVFTKSRELKELTQILEQDKEQTITKLLEFEKCNGSLIVEKEKLIQDYERLQNEKLALIDEKDKEVKCLGHQHEVLKKKYDELYARVSDDKSGLQNEFLAHARIVKKDIDRMISERNSLETVVFNLKESHIGVQIKAAFVTEEQHRLHFEQKQALDVIVEDIQKQFNRYSKMSFNVNLNTCQIFEKVIAGMIAGKPVNWKELFKDLDLGEILSKLDDLKDNANNTLEQVRAFEKSVQLLSAKGELKPRILKENNSTQPMKQKDDDWKKKYFNTKQRLTLTENAKNNYEKKVKQLREENNKLNQNASIIDCDVHYKNLLQQHIQAKEEHEKVISECDVRYKKLLREFEQYKIYNSNTQLDHVNHAKQEVEKIRESYSSVLGTNSRLELENATLHKLLDDRNCQLSNLHSIKEAYEKLFEENNKLMAEIDTLKYKRSRDRDEYIRLLKKDKDDGDSNKRLQDVRAEYELKLEKMKDKMIQLYKEEVDKQVENVVAEKDQNIHMLKTIAQLKEDLHKATLKLKNVESERSIVQHQLNSFQQYDNRVDMYNPRDSIRRGSTQSLCTMNQERSVDDRRFSTLPRNMAGMDIIEEVRICRRTSITSTPSANLEMEDEAEMFNNKYLTDLKEGRCTIPANVGRESTSSRMSELAYRNSLCPPHLKSSYPAETQFLNPRKYREDDLKTGHVEFNDSMSTRLLPNDKHKKKDVGTTTYKKPGPPTPSKNGGRLSLQGNEPHPRDVLKDANEHKTEKKTTPNRLKALFSRSKDSSENIPVSPKGRRLSIFRKPR